MKKILLLIVSGFLVFGLFSCSTATRPGKNKVNYSQQIGRGQTYNIPRESVRSYGNRPSYTYQTRAYRRTGPGFSFDLRKILRPLHINLNDITSETGAIIIVICAILLVVGFVIFQNRKSVRKGSFR